MKIAALALLSTACLHGAALLDEGFRQMYNLQFAEAHRTFEEYGRENPSDPLGPVSDAAAYLFGEFDRLHILQSELWTEDQTFLNFRKPNADPEVKKRFEEALGRAQRLIDEQFRRAPKDANALFAASLRLGLHSNYLAMIEKKNLAALAEVKQSRIIAEEALAGNPSNYDAYISPGLENYLLSLKPAPVRWILHMSGAETDRSTGLEKLRITAEKGHYLLPYARLLLAIADLRAHAPERAREKLQWLAAQFPGNRLYREELAKLK
jgi:hypothetical protein